MPSASDAPTRIEYRLLGPVEVIAGGGCAELHGPLERALLARLLLAGGRVVSLQQLVDDLWPADAPETAPVAVRVRVSRLRKALSAVGAAAAIRTQPPGYVLSLGPRDTLDIQQFEGLAERGRAALHEGDAAVAAAELDAALALWRGAPLGDLADAPFARSEAARLEEARVAAMEMRVDAGLALGRHASLVGELETICAAHPTHERFWGQRMIALYRCGRQGDALAVFRELRGTLRDQLGIDPSPDLCALELQILRQAPELVAVAPPAQEGAPTAEALPSGVVTFLLTDVEGSTELWERSPPLMASALARHDQVVTQTAREHGGYLIKSKGEGDATLSVFRRVTDAVAAAVDLQQALTAEPWPGGVDLRVRVALHTGEAHERDGDYFGPAVNRAARLRSVAAAGQIVLSRVTADLVRDHLPAGRTLLDLGEHELRGSARPERVYELNAAEAGDRPGPEAQAARPALPDTIQLATTGPFVGRDAVLQRLEALAERAAAGSAQAVFVSGEPGIGKTRLAAEFARRAHAGGALVLYGRSDEDSVLPYQPFIEGLGQYVGVATAALRRELPAAADLAHLLPELGPSRLTVPAPDDADTARYRLFEGVTATLAHAARRAPLVLVLDDLHWADRTTLQLLRHVLRAAGAVPMLIVGTYRESDLSRTRPFAEMLADLRRERAFERIALRGLNEDDVVELLEQTAQHDVGRPGRALAQALARTTDGNPFFMAQVLGHLVETRALRLVDNRWVLEERVENLRIPEGVLEAIGRRLSRLSAIGNRTLAAGSVLGRTFEIDVLMRMLDADPDEILTAVEEALAAGLVQELPARGRAAFMFTHALVQQALYDELTLARKQRLHLRAADAIETVHAADIEAHVPILAVHLRAAGAAADPARVIDASVRATRATWRVFAYEDAMAHAEAALELMEEHGGEPPERARLLERLGDLHFVAGIDYERGLDHLDNALHLFESLGVVPRATRVHLKLGRSLSMFWQVMDIPRARQHLLHAERVIGSSTDPEAAGRLAAALGLAALQAMDQELLADCAARCMELGRQIPNDALWATGASLQGHLQCCEGRFDEGLLLLEEAWAAADRIGHVAAAFGATWIAGGWAGIRDAAEGHRIVQRELDKPRQAKASHTRDTLVSIAATDLVLAGRLDDARRLYADVDRRPLEVFAGGGHEAYLLAPAEAERSIRAWAGRFTDSGNNLGRQSAARLLGDVFADIGDCDGARRSLDEAIELTGGQLPSGELYCRPQLAVIHVRDGRIAMARDQLGRCRELAARGCGTTNHNALYLLAAGVLAIAEGSSADGDRACAEALAIQVGASHRWYAARTLREWGRALIASGDRQGGADRLDQALEAYESMGIESAWTHSLVAERRRLETS